MNALIKTLTYSTLFAATMALADSHSSGPYAEIHKQLKVMNNIIKASVKSEFGRKGPRITNIDSTYLREQGVVFTIESARSHSFGDFSFVVPPLPVGEVTGLDDSFENDIEVIVEDALASAEDALSIVVKSHHDDRDEYRNLREEQRELAYETRDIEREVRDIEYRIKRSAKDQVQELEAEKAALEKEKKKLKDAKKTIEQRVVKIRQKQKERSEEEVAKRAEYYLKLTDTIADTLCTYGNGLNALPDKEKVTLILRQAGRSDNGSTKNRIYVFDKKDLTSCAASKIDSAKLLERGLGYEF